MTDVIRPSPDRNRLDATVPTRTRHHRAMHDPGSGSSADSGDERHPGDPAPSPDDVVIDLDGAAATVVVSGPLDAPAGEALHDALVRSLARSLPRVEVDLQGVTSFTVEGVAWLTACHALAPDLADGLHYRTGPGPGRDALLASYAAGATAG